MPIRGPAPGEIAERLGAVQEWVADWQRAGQGALRVEYRKIGGRRVGSNLIPCRAWLDGYDQVWKLLGVAAEVRLLAELTEATQAWNVCAPGGRAGCACSPSHRNISISSSGTPALLREGLLTD